MVQFVTLMVAAVLGRHGGQIGLLGSEGAMRGNIAIIACFWASNVKRDGGEGSQKR